MTSIVLACRLLLATTFLLAGIAKLVNGTATRRAVGELVPARIAGALSGLLPIAELAVGAALLQHAWAWRATLVAIALLVLFIVVTGVNIARGYVASCGCFGGAGGKSSAIAALVRNEVLVAIAAMIVWQGRSDAGPDVLPWMRALPLPTMLSVLALLVALALATEWAPLVPRLPGAATRLWQRTRDVAARRHAAPTARARSAFQFPGSGLRVGSRAPAVLLDGAGGNAPALHDVLSAGRPVLLVFANPACAPCETLRPRLARWEEANAHRFTVAVTGAEHCSCDGTARAARQAYRVPAVPSAVVIEPDGLIGSAVATGAAAIEALVSEIGARPHSEATKTAAAPSEERAAAEVA